MCLAVISAKRGLSAGSHCRSVWWVPVWRELTWGHQRCRDSHCLAWGERSRFFPGECLDEVLEKLFGASIHGSAPLRWVLANITGTIQQATVDHVDGQT